MSMDSDDVCEEDKGIFRPFTRESLMKIEQRIAEDVERRRNMPPPKDDDFEEPQPEAQFEAGNPLPISLQPELPPELTATPLEDIDKFYQNQKTFMVISKGKDIFRFSADNALYILSPFNPVRRVAIYILVHPLYSFFVIVTILVNCLLMTKSEGSENTEVIFTSIYTFESCIKVMARGFIFSNFTYLRDAWNWLDFIVICLAYLTMFLGDLGNLSVLRTFRVLRALKTVAIVPGLKTIVGAVIESVKNLKDVIILTLFSLSIFALLGLQIYTGQLTQKCVQDYDFGDNVTPEIYNAYIYNESNWQNDGPGKYILCGNHTWGYCSENFTCLQGIGMNPNYGYTNFDSFPSALLCAFRLMTQDAWENLYQLVLRAAGPVHMMFFIINIFLGSFYLLNLILAIVAMSYDDLQKQAEAEIDDALANDELLRERFGLPARPHKDGDPVECMVNSPSDLSSTGYDLYEKGTDDQMKQDKISLQSDGGDSVIENKPRANGKVRKGSLSLPGSPFNVRRGSRGSHQLPWRPNGRRFGDKKPLVLSTFLDAQEHLPYADDSAAVTPMSEENGAIIVPVYASIAASRHGSYTSHGSRVSYSSHGGVDLGMIGAGLGAGVGGIRGPITKETQLRSRRNLQTLVPEVVVDSNSKMDYGKSLLLARNAAFATNYAEESSTDSEDFMTKHKHHLDNPFVEPSQRNALLDMKDVMVLNDIIEQAAGRRIRGSEQEDEDEEKPKLKERCLAGCLRCLDIFCLWDCCDCWIKFQKLLTLVVYDPFVELFITLCIVVNTLFMAMDHYGISDNMSDFLKNGNYFFTGTFAFEASMKLLAISPKNYFKEGWNIFDFIIVVLSLVELGLASVQGLSVLRSFRLLRVFKLAKSWPTLNLLISIMGKTMGALGNLTFVLAIIIFIFAVMGMQLFGKKYHENMKLFPPNVEYEGNLPRWNFTDFMHSFMIVFRVLCGEWIESMWDCMLVAGWPCVPFFMATVVIGYLVVLNLFLALLLSSFGAANLSQAPIDNDTNKLTEAIERISRFNKWVKRKTRSLALSAMKAIRAKVTNQIADQTTDVREVDMDETSGEILVDGQVPMRDKKSPKEQLALEVALNDVVEITIHGDAVKMKNKVDQWNNKPICNSVKPEDNKEKDHPVNLMPKRSLRPDEDALSDNSMSSYKEKLKMSSSKANSRRTSLVSRSSDGEEKKDASKDDLDDDDEDDDDEHGIDEDQEMCGPEVVHEHTEVVGIGDDDDEIETLGPCLTDWWYETFPWCGKTGTPFWDKWTDIRSKTLAVINNKHFETFIIVMILLSSLALALEDKQIDTRPFLRDLLTYMDRVFTVIFFFEMLIKWLALGFQKYFTNAWCWLDFIIVVLSLMNLGAVMAGASNIPAFRSMRTLRALRPLRAVSRWEGMRLSLVNLVAIMMNAGNIPAFRSMRTLRALRPLRALSRLQGMRVVVNALVQAIPSIFNVLLVCLIFWLIFAIMGVQLFGGKYFKCVDGEGNKLMLTVVNNKSECHAKNFSWENSQINFDNVGQAYLSLFQVATFKGWLTIMNDAIDNRGENMQPSREVSIHLYLYFVFFIIFGTFFTLNLFIGVIIDNFNEQKKKAGGSLEMFMTEDQKKYYNAMKKMGSKKPLKAIPRPRMKLQAIVFDITTNAKFDMLIMLFISLNMVCMALEHYNMTDEFKGNLESLNLVFIIIFTAECGLKLFALRWYYFKEPWNMFDFLIVILSIVGIALKKFIEKYFVSPTLLRVVRVVKVGRVLRLVKGAKGIRTLLFALAMSLPALFNICLLLFLVMFIYAIFGMSFFMNVKHTGNLDGMYNFETFIQSMILLFQMSTSAGWSDVLAALMNEEDCEPADDNTPGNCGNRVLAIAFLVSYLVINCLIVINMYIAVILENYSQATEEVQEGLTDDDYDMYYEIWQRFDPDGSQYIPYDNLSDLFDTLEVPLQIHKPNKYKIVSMDIPICRNDMCYCVDILDALTKDFFARKGSPVEESADWQDAALKIDRPGYEPISSTLWRQREEFCARLIQKAWRRHRGKDRASSATATTHDAGSTSGGVGGVSSDAAAAELLRQQQQTAIVVDATKNGHKVVIHSRSPSLTSRTSTNV